MLVPHEKRLVRPMHLTNYLCSMSPIFEEKILYRTHQHWIVPAMWFVRLMIFVVIPMSVVVYFFGWYSWILVMITSFVLTSLIAWYVWFLWRNSWLFIWNQKITLFVKNGLWSQYTMSVQYRNVRDSAVSKNSFFGYMLGFWTFFVRSSAGDGEFQAQFIPKAWKVYALVNALSCYSDEQRSRIHDITTLHQMHQGKDYVHQKSFEKSQDGVEHNISILQNIAWITAVMRLDTVAQEWIRAHEESRNHGVLETLRRNNVLVFLHDSSFRMPAGKLSEKTASGEVYFPWVPFPEIQGDNVISGSPSKKIHDQIIKIFAHTNPDDASVLVGWDNT